MLLSKLFVRFGTRMLLALCVLLSEWCVPLECRCKVLVQGVACCHSAACSLEWACWCRCRALLQVLPEGAAVRVVCARFTQCFGAGMLVSGCRWTVLVEGAVELACWWRCKGYA